MNERHLFTVALGLAGTPWQITAVTLDAAAQRRDIHLDFPPGTRFPRPSDGQLAPVYDTAPRSGRHLNFFQYECDLHAFLPRGDGGEPDGGKTVAVPWARPGSGFTLLLEAMIMMLGPSGLTVAEVARTVSEHAPRLWRVLFHQAGRSHLRMDLSEVCQWTVDETRVRRGHEYVTVVCEPGQHGTARPPRVLGGTAGKDAAALTQARQELETRGRPPAQIEEVCTDRSPAYAKGVREEFPAARLVFDFSMSRAW